MSISVVIPCRNDAAWIQDALDSVARQTLQASEVIIVADCSTDESALIASQHTLNPKLHHTSFRNAAQARNHGVSQAKSDWIAFLDADDWWTDSHLERATRLLQGRSDVAFFGNYTEFWQDSSTILEKKPLFPGPPQNGLSSDKFYDFFLGENTGWPTSGMVIQKQRFEEVGGFDANQVRRHDTELFARVVFGNSWAYSPEPVFFYRKAIPDSISTANAACAYYRLKADLKITGLYGRSRASAHLARRAQICMSETLRSPADVALFEEARHICLPLLDPARRLYYHLAVTSPHVFRQLPRLWRKLHGQRSKRNPPAA